MSATAWDTYRFQVRDYCRQEFAGNENLINLCLAAFGGSKTQEEARKKLLCVGVDGEPDEVFECETQAAVRTYEQLVDPQGEIAKRSGPTMLRNALDIVHRGEGLLATFIPNPAILGEVVPPARARRIEAAAPKPPAPVAPAPPAPTALECLSSAVLRCVRGAGLSPTVLDAVIGTAQDVEKRLTPGEQSPEMCHQVADARIGYAELETFKSCLCPTAPTSLLQILGSGPV